MYDRNMNRMTAQVSFSRPAPTSAPDDLITHVPTAAEARDLLSKVEER